ncbi:unnamed protein product [Cyprideis torosa]|uniref:Uncharacterized protein n=1 Tax=Cyprideis torosa TaxID=163714 RepID=A0A7R8WKD7_9CRUS|nr:unnamed protein product [Cyprideis torosa]CAG0896829.1 unnamed protein product [Cyprideis torosa]
MTDDDPSRRVMADESISVTGIGQQIVAGKKKTTSFQITSVTDTRKKSCTSVEDDLDETLDGSMATVNDGATHVLNIEPSGDFVMAAKGTVSPIIPTADGHHGISIVTSVSSANEGSSIGGLMSGVPITSSEGNQPADVNHWQGRFRVVKIESREPYKRGRWHVVDFLDDSDTSGDAGGSHGSNMPSGSIPTVCVTTVVTSSGPAVLQTTISQASPPLATLPSASTASVPASEQQYKMQQFVLPECVPHTTNSEVRMVATIPSTVPVLSDPRTQALTAPEMTSQQPQLVESRGATPPVPHIMNAQMIPEPAVVHPSIMEMQGRVASSHYELSESLAEVVTQPSPVLVIPSTTVPVGGGSVLDAVEAGSALEDPETPAVAIDNKIEQAMDLVKSHLLYAVREEVDVLKERIEILQYENELLKSHLSPEVLGMVTQQVAQFSATTIGGGVPLPVPSAVVGVPPVLPVQPPPQVTMDQVDGVDPSLSLPPAQAALHQPT